MFLIFTQVTCSHGPTKTSREILDVQRSPASLERKSLVYSPRFDWPVEEARLTRGFLPHKKKRPHLGIDLAAPRGTVIFSSHSGTVIYAGRDFRGYGKMVLVEDGHGWATLYAHLDRILVEEGQSLTSRDIIGLMGRTGRATGVHLHFEIRKDKFPLDPLLQLPGGQTLALNK